MSDNSDEEDSIDNIDFSVISTAIETGGKTLDQILNAVHYGTPEVRFLLREACDFIFECKHCKNLFRAIPNFIAHKRIYCGEKSFFPQNSPKKKTKKKEEAVIVRPVSPSLTVPIETNSKVGGKTVLEQILTGSFQGNSDEYKHYTTAAEIIEKQKINTTSTVVEKTPIKNTENAVSIELVDVSDNSHDQTVSNASAIIAKAKKSQKQPLTKIVDSLKKSAKSSKDAVDTGSSSPKKLADKKTNSDSQPATSVRKNVSPQKNSKNQTIVSPQKNSKNQARSETSSPQKTKDKAVQPGKDDVSSVTEKTAKVVLKPLTQFIKPVITSTEVIKTAKIVEKKANSSNDLRPVKSQDGSELSELSQLGHCNLKQLKCLICNLQYSQKKTLLQHMHVIHSGTQKKYPCNICNKKFDYFWGLTRHLLLIHKKTKEEIDKMRPELRALAYTISEHEKNDEEESASQTTASEKNGSSLKTLRMKQTSQTLVKMSTCKGCSKSFWKKANYVEHAKQCRFLSEVSSLSKVKKQNKYSEQSEKQENDKLDNSKEKKQHKSHEQSEKESLKNSKEKKQIKCHEQSEKDEKESLKETIAARRRRVLEKLAESRRLNDDAEREDVTSDVKDGDDVAKDEKKKINWLNTEKKEKKSLSSLAASKRLRIDGKFVSKQAALKIFQKEICEENSEIKENKRKTNKNRVVQKLKEKSRSFVPAQRFISTRRSAEFFHSPAQRTRFHENRRAVVESPKKDNRTPSKSPTKSSSEPTTSTGKEQTGKKSPQEKSDLELARRNLLNAIEKVKVTKDSNTDKPVLSGKTTDNRKSVGKLQSVKKVGETGLGEKEKDVTPEVERSRSSVRRTQKKPSIESTVAGVKVSNKKVLSETPSRDTSVESVRSRQSSRSRRDISCDKSVETTSRSRQTVTNNREEDRSNRSSKSSMDRSRSRDTSIESTRSSLKSSNINEKAKDLERSRSIVKNSKSNMTESRDSSRESIRTRSSENLTDTRCPKSRHNTRQSESQDSEMSENSVTKISLMSERSPQISKQCKDKSITSNSPGEIMEGEKDIVKTKVPISVGINSNTQGVTSYQKSFTEVVSAGKSPGKDEIDGTGFKGQTVEKTRPKWSSKNWDAKKIEPKNKEELIVKENEEKSQKTVTPGTSMKGKLTKGKLKGITKQKMLKGKARYCTRSMKTRVQAAKKIGELKKRFSTRISDLKKNIDDNITSSSTDKIDKNEDVDQTEINQRKRNDTSDEITQNIAGKTEDTDRRKSIKEEKSPQIKVEVCNVDTTQQVEDEKVTTAYTHRQRNPSDMKGVRVIEEIWVSKEPGQPLQNVKCKKTIIDSPKKIKSSRMYVVDPVKPEKPKCMDFSRINHLVDYKNNKCLQCGIELTDISSLRRHAVRHLGWKRYKCKLCAYTGFNRSECNSHIKRRHAEKLISSSSPLSTFIIDLNKEASHVRNKKKQSTILKKNNGKIATRSAGNKVGKASTQTKCKPQGRSTIRKATEETNIKEEKDDSIPDKDISECKNSSNVVSPQSADEEKELKLTRKRKRVVSEEGAAVEKEENVIADKSNSGKIESEISENLSEQKAEIEEDLDEDIGSVSDYDEGEPPPRNVVSPTWTKMNPNVALMMATLEEARATKFSRGKRGRGGIRRFSSPLKKLPHLSTEDPDDIGTDDTTNKETTSTDVVTLSDGETSSKNEIQHSDKQTQNVETSDLLNDVKTNIEMEDDISQENVQSVKSDSMDIEKKESDKTGMVDTDEKFSDSKEEVDVKDFGIDVEEKTSGHGSMSEKEMPQVKDEGSQT